MSSQKMAILSQLVGRLVEKPSLTGVKFQWKRHHFFWGGVGGSKLMLKRLLVTFFCHRIFPYNQLMVI